MPTNSCPDPAYQRNPAVIQRTMDGKSVILHPKDLQIHVLNESATVIWRALVEPRTINELVVAITSSFAIDAVTAEADVHHHITMMERQMLVIQVPCA